MEERIIQLVGYLGVEGVYKTTVSDKEIQRIYKEYNESDFDIFDEFLESRYSDFNIVRIPFEKIYI